MAVSVHASPLPPAGNRPSWPRWWTSVLPWLGVVGLALLATVIHIQTRPAEPVPPALPQRSPAPAAPEAAWPPVVTAPASRPEAPGARVDDAPRSGPDLPPPPALLRPPALPPQGEPPRALQGVYGTAPACPNCGWVESVQAISSGGLPPGAAWAAGAAVGAQAGAGYGTSSARPGGHNVAATAAGAVVGASAMAGQPQGGYQIRIRMEDGSQRDLQQAEPLPLGAAVVLEGGVARLSSARSGATTGTSSAGNANASPAATGKSYGTR